MKPIYLILSAFIFGMGNVASQSVTPSVVCTLPGVVNESSGIEKTAANSFWTHNDSGGQPEIYNIDSSGTLIKTIDITNATNVDWEDVALGENGYFYIGDFGNNNNDRTASNNPLKIYIIQNPDLIAGTTTTATTLQFEYEDRNFSAPAGNHNFDMEGFFFYNDSLHLFTKNRTSPTNGLIKHYVLPAQAGTHTAELVDSFNNAGIRITSADMSPDHKTIALMANNRIFLVSCFESSKFFQTGYVTTLTIPNTQKEAIVFGNNNTVYLTDEYTGAGTGRLYRSNLNNYIASSITLTASISPTCPGFSTGSILVNPVGGTPSFTYSWSNGNNTNNNINLTNGTYFLHLSDNHGCMKDSTFIVPLNSVPTANANNTGPYCEGDTIHLNSMGGMSTDDWTGPISYSQINVQNPTILNSLVSMSGVYTVTVTNAAGCSATSTTTVIINSPPTASASNGGPYCEGDTIQLNSVGGFSTDDWSGPGGFIQDNLQNPFISASTIGMNGIYSVIVTDLNGCSSSASTNVIVNANPIADASNSGPYCEGDTIELSSIGGLASDDWSGPGSYIQNDIQNPSISPSIVSMSGSYTVITTNAFGCTASSSTLVNVNPLPNPTASNTGPYCSGETISLFSTGGTTNDWNGPLGFNQTDLQNPTILSSTAGMSGTYTVTNTNGNGCVATATTTVEVFPVPLTPTVYESGDTLFSNPSVGVSFQWYLNGGIISGETFYFYLPGPTGMYSVEITDSNICSSISNDFQYINTTSVDNNEKLEVIIYPNPANETFFIKTNSTEEISFELFDALGRVVLTGNKMINSISELSSGIYHLKVSIGNKFIMEKVMIE